MFKKITLAFVAASLLMLNSSCGVMFGGSKYTATIIAKDRPNADIYVDGQNVGKGTAKGKFPRNKPLAVELREEGCESQTLTYNRAFRTGNFILSIISWGIIGIAADLGSGAAYKPDHKDNPAVKKNSTKDFTFTVESPCK